ncbi:hypothetical protein BAU15_06845 [Enterococcus sp. JM4C]|uniref:glycosyltransferase n=1 Tax=Candidatus Enterococcus huntleyi TaxID=1857217 RepID=UPI0013799EAA|nr:glycosyltransferase [Enterococcus sp. JM4C]KAF1297258.1 hypothetical protein BAU15_06845 [Enterococcus sp. JM4C]
MMNVDLLIPRYSGKGGTETVVKKVAEYFEHTTNIRFHLVLSQGMDSLDWLEGFRDYQLNKYQFSNKKLQYISGILYLAHYFKKTDAQVIICLNTTMLRIAAFFKKCYKKEFKLVSWIHFSIFDEPAIRPEYLPLADYHLAISSGIKKQLSSVGIPNERIFLIYNPIDYKERTIVPVLDELKLIYIGRLMLKGQKNLSELFYALAELKTKWSLAIYGDGADRVALQELAAELGISDKIIFFGWVVNPWERIEAASALVLTSQFEGFPMVLLEAASYGLPCVSSNCPTGPVDIITVENGLIYPTNDIAALRQALSKINEKEFSSQLIKKSINQFYPETYFTVLEQFLYKIIS